MKVLMVNKFLYPNGGSETYIFEIGKWLEENGHAVEYFGMAHPKQVVGNHVQSYTENMDFHTGKLKKLFYPFKIIYSTEARRKMRAVLDDFAPDVVHLNNFNFQLTPSIIYEIRKYGKDKGRKIPILYTAHDYQLVCPNHMMFCMKTQAVCDACVTGKFIGCTKGRCIHGSLVKSILGSMEGYLYRMVGAYRHLDQIICPSFFLEKQLQKSKVLQGKTVAMHNFVNQDTLLEAPKEDYVLYFGRYSKEKGIQTLLEVCRRLPEVSFVFAGNGPLEEEVNQTKNIRNLGFLKQDEMQEVIRKARFSILASEWYENCPFSVMESQILGTPVLGADIGGIPELIQNKVTGELFESGNVADLEEKVRNLWENPKQTLQYSRNCSKLNFDSTKEYCGKLMQIYKDL